MRIQLKTRQPFAFPGLWDCWIDRDTGKPLYSFTITTHANALLRPIHDRMPLMYDREMGRAWLEQPVSSIEPDAEWYVEVICRYDLIYPKGGNILLAYANRGVKRT